MKRLAYIIALIASLCASCSQAPHTSAPHETTHKVAVLYSHDAQMQCYQLYDSTMEATFRQAGLDVEIVRVYIDRPDLNYSASHHDHIMDSLKATGVQMLITEGDLALHEALLHRHHLSDSIPIVAGGICYPMWERLRREKDLYVWYHEPKFTDILMDIQRLTQKNLILVEADHQRSDSVVLDHFAEAIRPMPFVSQLHLEDNRVLRFLDDDTLYRDSIVVLAASLERAENNLFRNDTLGTSAVENTARFVCLLDRFPLLSIKHDEYSTCASKIARRSIFTCLPYGFGQPGSKILVGYIVTMDTEARDVCQTAIPLLKGDGSTVLSGGQHMAQTLMDYNVMVAEGYDLREMQQRYIVVGVPANLHSFLSLTAWQLMGLLLLIFGLCLVLYMKVWNAGTNLGERLHRMPTLNFRLLSPQASWFYYDKKGMVEIDTHNVGEDTQHVFFTIEKFFSVVLPESGEAAAEFKRGLTSPGHYSIDMRISFNGGQDCHWWRYRFLTRRRFWTRRLETYGMLMLIDDEKKRLAELDDKRRLVEDMRRRENFLHTMNHEIRTPLNTVMGCSQLLALPEVMHSEEEQRDILVSMKQASEQLMNLVQDILSYSRIGSGRMHYRLEAMQVDEIMESLCAIFQKHMQRDPLIDENGNDKTGLLTLRYSQGPSGLRIMVDNQCVQQIMQHLMTNAIKFTPRGEIVFGWAFHYERQEVELYVADQGAGIAPEQKERLWKAFFKNDTTTTGVGLGLTLVKTMTEKMSGRVGVDTMPGRGAKFSVYFPVMG